MGETFNMALLDSGCSKTVCGTIWLDVYRQTLEGEMLARSKEVTPSSSSFKFGNDTHTKSLGKVVLPIYIDGWKHIDVEVISSEIPLLFSRGLMKKMSTTIGFEDRASP